MTGTYVALRQTKPSAYGLQNRLSLMGLHNLNDPDKYHTTVAFSKVDFPATSIQFPSEELTAIITEWTIFKTNADSDESENCLVAKLASPHLHELHRLCREAGASHDFPAYEPHITVSYRYRQKLNLKTLPVDYLVRFDPVPTIEPLIL